MSFLAGFLALFTALGVIPIIIHLLNRRQFRVVTWAAMEFLLKTMQKNSRRLQMRDIVLLLLRVCAVVFLALALARPTIAPGRFDLLGNQGATVAAIVLDNSLSMGFETGGESLFDAGKRRAKDIVDHLPKGSAASLILMSDISVDEISEPSHDLTFVGEEILKAPLSDGGTDVMQGLDKAWKSVAQSVTAAREIYLITDLQQGAWPAATEPAWMKLNEQLRAAKPPVKLFICDAGAGPSRDNIAVEALAAEDEVITTESDATFVASVRNIASAPAKNVSVDLMVGDPNGGELRKVAGTVIDQLDGAQNVRLATRFAEGGDHRVEIIAGLDPLGADNRRALSAEVIDRIKVLLIDGEPSPTDDPFLGETGFLQAALRLPDPDDAEHRSLIDVEVTTMGGVAEHVLDEYAAIVMANVGEVPPSLSEGLTTFVKAEGKGLIIFLGANVQPNVYNAILHDQAGLLPGRIGDQFIEAGEQGVHLATESLTNPIVSFFQVKENQSFLSKPTFRTFYPIDVAEGGQRAADTTDITTVVARFNDGHPAITERLVGRGSVTLFASTADKAWTDFPLTPSFLMITRRAVQQAVLGRRPAKTLGVHDPIVLMRGAKEAGTTVSVRDPRGGTAQLAAVPSLDLARFEFSDTHFAGFYKVQNLQDPTDSHWFAANAPRAESNLEAFDEQALRARYPDLDVRWIDRGSDVAAAVSEARVGKEIWPILFAIVVMSLLAESFFAQRWAPKGT